MKVTGKTLRLNATDVLEMLHGRGLEEIQILEVLAAAQAALVYSRLVAEESGWHSKLEGKEAREALAEIGFSPVEIEKLVLIARQNALNELREEFELRYPTCLSKP
ncbi:MAG: hypothetical protein E7630_02620 [Ruminococcaceae bacterium]|nr:hypothetical protein [Oscillospiraceae bacterium]